MRSNGTVDATYRYTAFGGNAESAVIYSDSQFQSMGGDGAFNHMDGNRNRGLFNKYQRRAFNGLSNWRSFAKGLPLLGDALTAWDAYKGAVDCYGAYCQ